MMQYDPIRSSPRWTNMQLYNFYLSYPTGYAHRSYVYHFPFVDGVLALSQYTLACFLKE